MKTEDAESSRRFAMIVRLIDDAIDADDDDDDEEDDEEDDEDDDESDTSSSSASEKDNTNHDKDSAKSDAKLPGRASKDTLERHDKVHTVRVRGIAFSVRNDCWFSTLFVF